MELHIPVQDLYCILCSQKFENIDSFKNHHKHQMSVFKPIVVKIEPPSSSDDDDDEIIHQNKNLRTKSTSSPSNKIVSKQVKSPPIVNKSKQIVQKSKSNQEMTKPGPLSKKLEAKSRQNELVAMKQNSRARPPSPDPISDETKCLQNEDLISIRCNVCDKHFFSLKKFLAHLKIIEKGTPIQPAPPPSALKPQQSIKVQALRNNNNNNNNKSKYNQDEDEDSDDNYDDDGFDNCASPFSPNLDDLLKENDPMDINLEDDSIQNLLAEETKNVKSSTTRKAATDKRIKQKTSTTATTSSALAIHTSSSKQSKRENKLNDENDDEVQMVESDNDMDVNNNSDDDDGNDYADNDDDDDDEYHPYSKNYNTNLNARRRPRASSKPNFVSTSINTLPLVLDKKIGLRCPKCKRKFDVLDKLKRHWKRQRIVKCQYCDEFDDMACAYFRYHAGKHNKKHKCEVCGKMFGRPAHLRDHMFSHTKEKPYACEVENCTETFARKKALELHHLKVHSGKEPEFSCDQCSRTFYFECVMNAHKKHHTEERNFICSDADCGKAFKTKSALREHETAHQTPEQWTKICPFPSCGLAFRTASALAKHKKTHVDSNEIPVDEQGFQCLECKKNFKTAETLEIHLQTQCTVFTCPKKSCKKSFGRRGMLNQHIKNVHLKASQVICDICGKTMGRPGDLRKHLKIHEGVKAFACQFCGKQFTQKVGCQMHERTHTQEKNYCCNFCGRKFIQSMTLTRHLQCHTGEKPFKCHCGEAFPDLRPLKKHKLTCTVPEPENVSSSEEDEELFKLELEQGQGPQAIQQLPPFQSANNESTVPDPQFFVL